MLGITQSAYGFYEQGRREPPLDTLHKLAKIFDVSVDQLLGLSESANDPPSMTESRFKRVRVVNDPFQQMIDEAIEQLDPEERRIIEKIRSMPDLDLQFKDFESDPVQNLRDLVKVWREIHPEDFEEEQKNTGGSSAPVESKEKNETVDRTVDREAILARLEAMERRLERHLNMIERHLALITGFGLEDLLLLRHLKNHPEMISKLMKEIFGRGNGSNKV